MKTRHNSVASNIAMMHVLKLPPFDGPYPFGSTTPDPALFAACGGLFELALSTLLKIPESTRKNSAIISTGALSVAALYLYSDVPNPPDDEIERMAIALGAGAILAGLFDHFYLTPHYLKKIENQVSLKKESQKPSGT